MEMHAWPVAFSPGSCWTETGMEVQNLVLKTIHRDAHARWTELQPLPPPHQARRLRWPVPLSAGAAMASPPRVPPYLMAVVLGTVAGAALGVMADIAPAVLAAVPPVASGGAAEACEVKGPSVVYSGSVFRLF